jgi:hypothetical protein
LGAFGFIKNRKDAIYDFSSQCLDEDWGKCLANHSGYFSKFLGQRLLAALGLFHLFLLENDPVK